MDHTNPQEVQQQLIHTQAASFRMLAKKDEEVDKLRQQADTMNSIIVEVCNIVGIEPQKVYANPSALGAAVHSALKSAETKEKVEPLAEA